MEETMMNTVEEVLEETAEVKPTLSKGAVVFLTTLVVGAATYGIYRLVKKVKAKKANAEAEAEAEVIEISEDDYSEVENG